MIQILLPARARADGRHNPDVVPLPDLEHSHLWDWMADHLDGPESVTGGLSQVRVLVRAIDGAGWPWTTVNCPVTHRSFQVLGTFDACVLEVGHSGPMRMVARAGAPSHWREMPEGAQHWVRRARATELFTAAEAAEIGLNHMCGRPLPEGMELRTVHTTSPGTRK